MHCFEKGSRFKGMVHMITMLVPIVAIIAGEYTEQPETTHNFLCTQKNTFFFLLKYKVRVQRGAQSVQVTCAIRSSKVPNWVHLRCHICQVSSQIGQERCLIYPARCLIIPAMYPIGPSEVPNRSI